MVRFIKYTSNSIFQKKIPYRGFSQIQSHMGMSSPSLLIKSTDSMMYKTHGLFLRLVCMVLAPLAQILSGKQFYIHKLYMHFKYMLVKFWPHKPSNRFLNKLQHLVKKEPGIILCIDDDPPLSKRPCCCAKVIYCSCKITLKQQQ